MSCPPHCSVAGRSARVSEAALPKIDLCPPHLRHASLPPQPVAALDSSAYSVLEGAAGTTTPLNVTVILDTANTVRRHPAPRVPAVIGHMRGACCWVLV